MRGLLFLSCLPAFLRWAALSTLPRAAPSGCAWASPHTLVSRPPFTRAWAARVASGLHFLVRGSPCSGWSISFVAADLPAPHVPLSAQPLLLSRSFFSRPSDFPVGSCFLSQIVRILNKFFRPTVKNCSFLCRSGCSFPIYWAIFFRSWEAIPCRARSPPLSGRTSLARLIVALALPWCRTCFFAGPVCFLLESTLLFSCRFAPLLSSGLSSRTFPPVMVFSAKVAPLLRLSVLLLSFPLVLNGSPLVAFVLCLLRRCPPLNEQNLSYEEAGKN